jgi:hypothetical protein
MSVTATALVALTFGPFVLLSFLVDPVSFLARNGPLGIGYLAAAWFGTILYLSVGVRVATAAWRLPSRSPVAPVLSLLTRE